MYINLHVYLYARIEESIGGKRVSWLYSNVASQYIMWKCFCWYGILMHPPFPLHRISYSRQANLWHDIHIWGYGEQQFLIVTSRSSWVWNSFAHSSCMRQNSSWSANVLRSLFFHYLPTARLLVKRSIYLFTTWYKTS